jgi:hypothetical protein
MRRADIVVNAAFIALPITAAIALTGCSVPAANTSSVSSSTPAPAAVAAHTHSPQSTPTASPPAEAAPAPPTTAAAAPAACTPLTDGGKCYEPGEFCRDDDHGATGVAGDGKKIECEDNDGWRWEPV